MGRRTLRRLVLPGLPLFCILGYAFLRTPGLPRSQPEGQADAIVVLGGMAPERIEMAVELYQKGIAPMVIVSGDRGMIVKALEERIPAGTIRHENAATSTWENARFTEPMLRQAGAREVVVVTSWYHARRALLVFRHCMPDIHLRVAYRPKPGVLPDKDRQMSSRERLACWHTTLVHGVWCL